MNNRLRLLGTRALLALLPLAAGGNLLAAPGTLVITKQPGGSTVALLDTFTLVFAISGHSGSEVDGFNFRVTYDPARFALVPSSGQIHDAPGPEENWLRQPNQENVGPLSLPLADFAVGHSGVWDVSVGDLRLPPTGLPPHGTVGSAGFLYAVSLQAIGTGLGAIGVEPGAGGTFLFDADLQPVGTPDFSTNLIVTVTGPALAISRSNNLLRVTWPTGVLQSATSLPGAWTNVAGATNPLTVPATGRQRYYRAVLP